LGRCAGVLLHETKMVDVGMAGEIHAIDHPHALSLRFDAGKLDPAAGGIHLHAVEALVEIEMPPRAAELAVGPGSQADLLLPPDDLLDLAILHRLERVGCDLALGVLLTRLPERGRA